MDDVKRYWCEIEHQAVEVVRYADYAVLRARLEAVEAQRNEAAMLLQLHMKRAERAEAALATARRDALLDAINVVMGEGFAGFHDPQRKRIAAAIRALTNEAET